jgi:hypothetical protein
MLIDRVELGEIEFGPWAIGLHALKLEAILPEHREAWLKHEAAVLRADAAREQTRGR